MELIGTGVGGTYWNGCPPVEFGAALGLTLRAPTSGAFSNAVLRHYYGCDSQLFAPYFVGFVALVGACGGWLLQPVVAAAFWGQARLFNRPALVCGRAVQDFTTLSRQLKKGSSAQPIASADQHGDRVANKGGLVAVSSLP